MTLMVLYESHNQLLGKHGEPYTNDHDLAGSYVCMYVCMQLAVHFGSYLL